MVCFREDVPLKDDPLALLATSQCQKPHLQRYGGNDLGKILDGSK